MTHTIKTVHAPHKTNKRRIHELDFLRGFFILVIIIDHLQRWPSPLSYLTGEGRLWVSAAEGFFIISGLLIGYLRGYKGLKIPMRNLTGMLVRRAAKLYIWSIIITLIAVFIMQHAHYDASLMPKLPETSGLAYLWQVITQQYVFDWIYFLRLYWIMLVVSPLAIWAFRLGKWWLVPIVSVLIYAMSFFIHQPEAAMQWQVLFFIAATIGWHFEKIVDFIRSHPRIRLVMTSSLILITFISMVVSYFWVLGWESVESGRAHMSRDSYVATRSWLDLWFTKDPLAIGRVLLAFIWFGGLLALMHWLKPFIERYGRWLLTPLGTYSLTSYTVQAVALLPFQIFLPISQNHLYNFVLAIVAVLVMRYLTTERHIHRLLPQ